MTTHLEEKRAGLLAKREKLISRLTQAARDRKGVLRLCGQIQEANEFLDALDKIESETRPALRTGARRFVVSSLFLHESFKKLTADQDEQFFFITGTELDGVMVLDQWAEFAHQQRSMVGVTADVRSTHRLLIKLEQFGHRLLAHFHSHPGKGAEATRPSGTDRRYQESLERAGFITVMAIFSRDGYVRFLRLDNNADIEVHGTGVEEHEPGIFRLTNLD